MLTPDMCNRTYTAEVLRTRGDADLVLNAITSLTTEHRKQEKLGKDEDMPIVLQHSFVASAKPYHRSSASVESPELGTITLPRTKDIRRKQHFLYDVLLARCGRDIVVAVPFHGLAEVFFVQVDSALAGKKVGYEKLDITNMVIRMGQSGIAEVSADDAESKVEIGISRCQLAYSDPQERSRDLQQVSMSGGNLGASDVYGHLITPVLKPESYPLTVIPILMGFSLFVDGIKKTSAITDRHGNFKLWIGPGASRIERLFALLKGIETIEGIVSTTGNVPILQSRTIRGPED